MPRVSKERAVMGLGFLLSALLAFYFLRRVDLTELGATLKSANLLILAGCILTKGAVFSLGALRSRVFLRPLRLYSFTECFAPLLAGYVTNNLVPFRLGELVRIDLLARTGDLSRGSTLAVAALERLLDLLSFLVLLVAVVPMLAVDLSGDRRFVWALAAITLAVAISITVVARPRLLPRVAALVAGPLSPRAQAWLFDKAERVVDGFSALRSTRAVFTAVFITFLIRLAGLTTIQCWIWAFDLDLPVYAPVVVMVFLSVGTMVPSSPGFVGTFHVAVAYALELMGIDATLAASVAIAGHFMATIPWTLVGLAVSLPAIRSVWKQRSRQGTPAQGVVGT
ncbi:MAG: lysylphosphatidylglycerol synthase transmembrane domain-containing protein [Polyangiales bacterium]